MRPLLIFLGITCIVPVQTHIISLLPFSFPLDLIMIATYYYGYFQGKIRGMVVGGYLGIITDILSGEILGTQMFLKTLIGYFSAVFGFGIFSKDLPVHFLLLLLFSLINGLLNLFLINLFGGDIPFRAAFMEMIIPSMGWNALVGSFVIFLLQRRTEQEDHYPVNETID